MYCFLWSVVLHYGLQKNKSKWLKERLTFFGLKLRTSAFAQKDEEQSYTHNTGQYITINGTKTLQCLFVAVAFVLLA